MKNRLKIVVYNGQLDSAPSECIVPEYILDSREMTYKDATNLIKTTNPKIDFESKNITYLDEETKNYFKLTKSSVIQLRSVTSGSIEFKMSDKRSSLFQLPDLLGNQSEAGGQVLAEFQDRLCSVEAMLSKMKILMSGMIKLGSKTIPEQMINIIEEIYSEQELEKLQLKQRSSKFKNKKFDKKNNEVSKTFTEGNSLKENAENRLF